MEKVICWIVHFLVASHIQCLLMHLRSGTISGKLESRMLQQGNTSCAARTFRSIRRWEERRSIRGGRRPRSHQKSSGYINPTTSILGIVFGFAFLQSSLVRWGSWVIMVIMGGRCSWCSCFQLGDFMYP